MVRHTTTNTQRWGFTFRGGRQPRRLSSERNADKVINTWGGVTSCGVVRLMSHAG
jgi:hypothetical protein